MTDVLIYWRDFERNVADGRVHAWYSNSNMLAGLEPGDRLWMVTSGANTGNAARQAGFLVAIWEVAKVVENPNDDPTYLRDDYRYRVICDREKAVEFAQPILVDHLLRPEGRDKTISIGTFLQGPRKLSEQKVRLLRAAAGPDLALKWLTGKRHSAAK